MYLKYKYHNVEKTMLMLAKELQNASEFHLNDVWGNMISNNQISKVYVNYINTSEF